MDPSEVVPDGPLGVLEHEVGKEGIAADGVSIDERYRGMVLLEGPTAGSLGEAQDSRDILVDVHSLGQEEGHDHDGIHVVLPEIRKGILHAGGVHGHEPAPDHELGAPGSDQACSLLHQFLVVRQLAAVPYQQQTLAVHHLISMTHRHKMVLNSPSDGVPRRLPGCHTTAAVPWNRHSDISDGISRTRRFRRRRSDSRSHRGSQALTDRPSPPVTTFPLPLEGYQGSNRAHSDDAPSVKGKWMEFIYPI